MRNIMIDLSYKVRGGFSPNGLQKVFFSFHPSDIEQMERISGDVLSLTNCAIYYHTDAFSMEEVDLKDYGLKLGEMKLFVVIVTTNYLMNDSLSKNWDYGFAVEHNIPIIPIAAESELEGFFAAEMNRIGGGYGDIQLIKSQVTDKTEIPYRQKLLRELGRVLVDDKEIERINKAFRGKIFLSYRKKDRKYANELMRTIHNIPSLRNVSIWYDEFLSPREKWSSQIRDALMNSDVFLLMVTPSITEPDNYVIREEYPTARKQNKKIVSARKAIKQSETLDLEELDHAFPGLKIFIDGNNAAELEDALHELAYSGESTPEQDYLIGLAFFNGIDVERDHEKAVSLIVASARKGLPDAVNKLAEMYWTGDGIAVNYENSIQWRKKLIEIYGRQFTDMKSPEEMLNYLKALERLTSCLYELSAYRESLMYGKRLASLTEQIASISASTEYFHYLIHAYDLCEENCLRLGLLDEAVVYAGKYYDFFRGRYAFKSSTTNLHNLSVAYGRMGKAYHSIGDLKQAEVWYLQALEADTQIDAELQSIDSAYGLSASSLDLGDIYMRNGAYEKADQCFSQAVNLRKKILDAEDSDEHRKEYGEAILAWGTSSLLKGDIIKAKKQFHEARDITKKLAEEYGTISSQHICSVALNRCGKVCEAEKKFREALGYYSDSLNRRKKILSRIRTAEAVYEYALTLFFRAGTYQHLYDYQNAMEDYGKIVDDLLPILSKDRRGDWHRIFAESAFERFKSDTFAGKQYLQYAIDAWKWLVDRQPENNHFQKQYELCRKVYRRCYPR